MLTIECMKRHSPPSMREITIAPETAWGGTFQILNIGRRFKNGNVSVEVNFHGKPKIFHLDASDLKKE